MSPPINIGNPNEMTRLVLLAKIRLLSGSQSAIVFDPLPTDDPKLRKPAIQDARTLLRWAPQVDVDSVRVPPLYQLGQTF